MEHYSNSSSGNGSTRVASAFLCSRQSSTRWIPTADQIRILRELYYNNGVRSPNAEQIQRITARLRQFGKIEGKNVFYWFQNHKARERQKKKLTAAATLNDVSSNTHHLPFGVAAAAGTAAASPGFYDHGQTGNGSACAAGSMFIERSFRECCLSGGDGQVYGLEPSVPWMYQCIKDEEESNATATRDIQILPLFPTRSQEHQQEQEQLQEEYRYGYTYNDSDVAATASLELTLNSYYYAPPGC